MKRILITFATLMIAISTMAASTPAVTATLVQANLPSDTVFLRGPINVQYQLTITNPGSEPLTLSRLNLSTLGPGGYRLHTGDTIVKAVVPANGSVTLNLSAWAYARGGFARSTEPVEMRGQLWLAPSSGKTFVKQFTQYIPQM